MADLHKVKKEPRTAGRKRGHSELLDKVATSPLSHSNGMVS